jgi:hypothetical protein
MIAKQEQLIESYFTQYRLLIEVSLTQRANVTACSIAEHALKLSVKAESMRRIHDLRIETRTSVNISVNRIISGRVSEAGWKNYNAGRIWKNPRGYRHDSGRAKTEQMLQQDETECGRFWLEREWL